MRFYKMQICSNLLIFICIMSHGVLLDFVLCLPASSTWLKSRKSLIYETFLLSLSNMGILFFI